MKVAGKDDHKTIMNTYERTVIGQGDARYDYAPIPSRNEMSACEKWSFCPLGNLALIDNADEGPLNPSGHTNTSMEYNMMTDSGTPLPSRA